MFCRCSRVAPRSLSVTSPSEASTRSGSRACSACCAGSRRSVCALLFISCELHQLRIACDDLAYFSGGRIAEIGALEEVLDFPKHPATKEYVSLYRGMPGGAQIGAKLGAAYEGLKDDEQLKADWLPPARERA